MDVKIFLSILLICGVVEGQIKKPAGPPDSEGYKYELEIQRVEPANNTDFVTFQGLKVKRYNRTFFVADGKFAMNVDFDDTWEVEIWCWRDRLGNNQWELTAFKVPRQPTSEFIKNVYIEYIQNDIGPSSDLPSYTENDPKVFPKGVYTVTNYVGDVKNFPPYMQDGVYRIEIFLSQKKVIQTGFLVFWKVYPEVG